VIDDQGPSLKREGAAAEVSSTQLKDERLTAAIVISDDVEEDVKEQLSLA
jgi:hypothetical protein